jgi:hypothetical protein
MDKKLLVDTIKKAMPIVIEDWNERKIKEFEHLFEKTFKDYFHNKQTQEKTKLISPIIDILFSKTINKNISNFIIDERIGKDYSWDGEDFESKISLSPDNYWTGNGYKKTNNHILIKFFGFVLPY